MLESPPPSCPVSRAKAFRSVISSLCKAGRFWLLGCPPGPFLAALTPSTPLPTRRFRWRPHTRMRHTLNMPPWALTTLRMNPFSRCPHSGHRRSLRPPTKAWSTRGVYIPSFAPTHKPVFFWVNRRRTFLLLGQAKNLSACTTRLPCILSLLECACSMTWGFVVRAENGRRQRQDGIVCGF